MESNDTFLVVIGASAGGLESLAPLFKHLRNEENTAYLIIQHFSSEFETILPSLLTRQTGKSFRLIEDDETIRGGDCYIIPPKFLLRCRDGKFLLSEKTAGSPEAFHPIDVFLQSAANQFAGQLAAVILSGTGNDGCRGIVEVARSGGVVLVESPESAKFDGMPNAALDTRVVQQGLSLAEIADQIHAYTQGRVVPIKPRPTLRNLPNGSVSTIDRLFLAIYNLSRIDFHDYQERTILRRLERRSRMAGYDSIDGYCAVALKDDAELERIKNDLILGVTGFYRHSSDLMAFRGHLLARLRRRSPAMGATLRVWVIGCATGEEAFTVAFIINDILTELQLGCDLKVFATDIDEVSLKQAVQSEYSPIQLIHLPAQWRKNYFVPVRGSRVTVIPEIREQVVFAKHNIVADPPFSDIDAVCCRNLLIYFKPGVKNRILDAIGFSLKEKGLLLLGPSESIPVENRQFESLQGNCRLFEYCPVRGAPDDVVKSSSPSYGKALTSPQVDLTGQREQQLVNKLNSLLVRHLDDALVINNDFYLEYIFGEIAQYLDAPITSQNLRINDVFKGEFAEELLKVIRSSEQAPQVVKLIRQVRDQGSLELDVVVKRICLTTSSKDDRILIQLKPHLDTEIVSENAASSSAHEVTRLKRALLKTRREAEQLRDRLDSVTTHHRMSQEELKASNEELQANGEELQSTNEELQAVNEELYTVNSECQLRIAELSELSRDINNVYEVSEIGTLFIDKELKLRKFNEPAQKLFSLIADDIGRTLETFALFNDVNMCGLVQNVLEAGKTVDRVYKLPGKPEQRYLVRAALRAADKEDTGQAVVVVLINISSITDAILSVQRRTQGSLEVNPSALQ